MKVSFINSHRPNAGSLSLRKYFSNLKLFRLFSIRQKWGRWVGWCSSIQGVVGRTGGGLLLLVFLVFFAACEDKNNDVKIPTKPVYSLVGTWYVTWSDIATGYKYIFSDDRLTAYVYASHEEHKQYFWEDVKYVWVDDTTIKVPHLPGYSDLSTDGHLMSMEWFHPDIIFLRNAYTDIYWDWGWGPPQSYPIWLHRRDNNAYY